MSQVVLDVLLDISEFLEIALSLLKKTLVDLISFKTVSTTPNTNIISYLTHIFSQQGFETLTIPHPTDPHRANLLCRIGPDIPGGLMLSGHTDVVPTEGQDWHSDPFTLLEQDGCYIGRGTTDMKGFIAATFVALSELDLKKLKKPLSLLWTYDEEIGCRGSFVAAPLLHNFFKHLPEAALIGEPTDFQVLRMHSGHVTLYIHAKGKGAHSSDPFLGISAIKALNQVLNGIFSLEQELAKETSLCEFFERPFVTLNVGQIKGGSAVNIIPDEATATIGFRPLPDTSVETIMERINARAHSSCTIPGAKIRVELDHCSPAMITESNTKLEKILDNYRQAFTHASAAFSTDAGNLNHHGIPCLIFGPGNINIAHQANEWIAQSALIEAVEKLKGIITDYCG